MSLRRKYSLIYRVAACAALFTYPLGCNTSRCETQPAVRGAGVVSLQPCAISQFLLVKCHPCK